MSEMFLNPPLSAKDATPHVGRAHLAHVILDVPHSFSFAKDASSRNNFLQKSVSVIVTIPEFMLNQASALLAIIAMFKQTAITSPRKLFAVSYLQIAIRRIGRVRMLGVRQRVHPEPRTRRDRDRTHRSPLVHLSCESTTTRDRTRKHNVSHPCMR